MRLIFRVTLAITAIFLCVMYTRKITSVSAQVFSESCSQLDNDCISNGGTTSSCETQYNDCMAERQSDCRNNTSPACQTNYSDSADGCVNSCNPNGGCSNPPPTCPNAICDNTGGTYFWNCGESPIIIDVAGRGFHLTDAANGVLFDFPENGQRTQVAWTDPQYGNAWLALDRNGNGIIDNATELFGNFTPQPQTSNPNGFLALGVYDDPANGGNGDGLLQVQIQSTPTFFFGQILITMACQNLVS